MSNPHIVLRNTFFFLFLIYASISHGQQRKFAHIGLPAGLPQETGLAMAPDTLGMVSLGTSDGLVRYDGSQFHLPLADNESQLDIAGYRIGAVTSYNNYALAGTSQKGLMGYDMLHETTQSLGDSETNCTAILPLKQGFIAGYFDEGISYFNNNFEEIKLTFTNTNPNRITAIALHQEQLYIGADNGKLFSGNYK